MTALLIAKALLLDVLIVACGALIVTYVRRRRAGVQPWETPTPQHISTCTEGTAAGTRRPQRPTSGLPTASLPRTIPVALAPSPSRRSYMWVAVHSSRPLVCRHP